MLKSLLFFVRYYIFWLVFFAVDRLLFMGVYHTKMRKIPFSEQLATFYHALRLDLSMTGYILIIPLLVFIFWYFTNRNQINFSWIKAYNAILIVLFSAIGVINFNIYKEWGSKINNKVIEFVIHSPKEALASSASSPIGESLLVLSILLAVGFYLNFILIKKPIEFKKEPLTLKIPIAILVLGLNFLIIRGGIGTAPNSQSMAYFSNYQILNIASLNTEWNLMSSILASGKVKKNPYLFFNDKTAQQLVSELYKVKKDTTIHFLKTERPNIVLFILESFTADLTQILGATKGVTPNLDNLAKKGILFSKIYSTGNRTDKGLIGTLAGFPTLASGSIVKWPEKLQKLPGISRELFKEGYQTAFYYGGESEFDNYKAYILGHDFKKLTDKRNFEAKDMNSKWGAFDNVVFNRQLKDANSFKTPFFSTILSLTNHEPFELPTAYKFGNENVVNKFKSTAFFTDSCIGNYLSEAKKQDWYKNTLFIFIADHGHPMPKLNHEVYEPQRFHIPLIFFGDVILEEFRGKNYNQIGSQLDLASTLLKQLNLNNNNFYWSNNLMNPYRQNFAYFSWDNGLGFVNENHTVTFDNLGKNILYNSNPQNKSQTDSTLNYGKAFLQTVYQQFINN